MVKIIPNDTNVTIKEVTGFVLRKQRKMMMSGRIYTNKIFSPNISLNGNGV
ncbi:hypothetical protein [Methanocella sp. MCL-LM]|uniref:hypothetical protein n=1 Tax=Methanocella sp. MCL-LM TaxID=3412035 RepID=UPI003C753DEE